MSCNLRIGRDPSYILVCHKNDLPFGGMSCSPLHSCCTIWCNVYRSHQKGRMRSTILTWKYVHTEVDGWYMRMFQSDALVSCFHEIADTTANVVSTWTEFFPGLLCYQKMVVKTLSWTDFQNSILINKLFKILLKYFLHEIFNI